MSEPRAFDTFLGPWRGDDLAEPQQRLRLLLRRVEIAGYAMILNAIAESIFGYFRQSLGMAVLCAAAILLAVGFIAAARIGQRSPAASFTFLPDLFVVTALLCAQGSSYFVAGDGRLPAAYATVYLAFAAFLPMPTRRFALIGVATFACFVLWVSLLPHPAFDKVIAIFNTSLAVVAGILGRKGLERMQEVEWRQRAQISAQNAALAEANDRLARANTELNDLMAVAAHDLRSPLFGLRSLLDLAASRPLPEPAAWRNLLGEASASITAMLALVSRLLEAHEIEGRHARPRSDVDLGQALDRARRRARGASGPSGVAIEVEPTAEPVLAVVDPESLDQILDNLVSNAIRFSPSGTTVRLRAGRDPFPLVEVIDEGIGVAPEDRAKLFGKFRRGSRPPVNGPRGSGLGLHIVRLLAAAMDAESGYRPRPEGGSVFSVHFPEMTRR